MIPVQKLIGKIPRRPQFPFTNKHCALCFAWPKDGGLWSTLKRIDIHVLISDTVSFKDLTCRIRFKVTDICVFNILRILNE